MPIHVSYFGKQNPKTATKPISSYTWDKPPFGQEATVDWKTGKVRSALFQEEKEKIEKVVPFVFPQWNVTSEKQDNGDLHIVVAEGIVVWCQPSAEKERVSSVITCHGVDLGVHEKDGYVVWVAKEINTAGEIRFMEGVAEPVLNVPSGEDAESWVPLARVVMDNKLETLRHVITQEHGDIIFISEQRVVEVVPSEEKFVTFEDVDGGTVKCKVSVDPTVDGNIDRFTVGLEKEVTPPVPDQDPPPPCGHPGNQPGGGAGTPDDDPSVVDNDHPGDTPGVGLDTDHPGEGEGEDGVTPESSGECQ